MPDLLERYLAGPQELRMAVAGMTDDQLDAAPVPGQWTTRQVVAHLADCELVYADRMKRVLAENEPTFFGLDPDIFAAGLAYERRDLEEELQLVEAVRRHMGRVLAGLSPETLSRKGIHSVDGPLSLETLLSRITNHIPHHVTFIEQKRAALAERS